MTRPGTPWLIAAAVLDVVAALIHFGCIVGGASWYRFFGAGEPMARMAENGRLMPHLFAFGIGAMLTVWALYALSGAGVIGRLPLLRTALVTISTIYLCRALALPLMLTNMPDSGRTFLIVSSAIVMVYGIVHAVGTIKVWRTLN